MKWILFLAVIMIAQSSIAQSFPSGGYQGGTHGNVRYTLWTGTVDNDWATPGNWCPAIVPDETVDVVIPASAIVMPEVKSEGMSCKSLTLEPGAEVDILEGFTLTVKGQEIM